MELNKLSECEKLFNTFIDSKNNDDIFQISSIRPDNDHKSLLMICHYKNYSHSVGNFTRLNSKLKKLKLVNDTYTESNDQVIKLNTYKKEHRYFPWF